MVKKEGPCCHCGTMSSPLWRNGPPEKPVLCNACGTRWRTKGTLDNYTPARRPEDAVTERKQPKKRPIRRMLKKEPCSDHNLGKTGDDADTNNLSGFGSAVSNSGSAQSHARESLVPSRKKTCVRRRKPSTVETLAEYLNSIMLEEKLRSGSGVCTIPGSSQEDLLIYHSKTPAGSFEIGYGSMLLRHPEDSKSYITSESYSYPGPASFALHSGRNRASNTNAPCEKLMWSPIRAHESARRDKQRVPENVDSALVSVPVQENYSKKAEGRGNPGGAFRGPTKSSIGSLKRPHESHQQSFTDAEVRGRIMKKSSSIFGAMASSQLRMPKFGNATGGAAAAALNQFMLPPGKLPSMLAPPNKHRDQDSPLLEVPRNARYPNAELLRCWPPPSQLSSVPLTAASPPSYQSQRR